MTNEATSPEREAIWRHPRAKGIAIAVLVLAVVISFANGLGGPFVLDDEPSILGNRTLRSIVSAWSPPPEAGVGGRPLLNVTFAVNYALGRLEPRGYHVGNLVIHLAAALLVFSLVRRTLTSELLARDCGARALPIAAATALLWAVHPVQAESVTYVSQRAEALVGLCALATLYCFVRSVSSPLGREWRIGSLVACWLGAGVKETIVVVPVVVLLYDWVFVARGSVPELRTRRRYYTALAASWIWLAWLMTHSGVGARLSAGEPGLSSLRYALISCGAVWRYVRLVFWPSGLVIDLGPAQDLAGFATWVDVVGVVILLGGLGLAWWRWPAVGFAGTWFALMLAPTTSVVPIAGQPVADHRMYLALLAPVVVVVAAAVRWGGARAVVGLGVVALAAGTGTWWRNRDYRSAEAIWSDAVAKAPRNPRAWDALGLVLLDSLRLPEARRALEVAVTLRPQWSLPHSHLAVVLSRLGEVDRAIEAHRRAVELDPDDPGLRNAYAVALAGAGRFEEAWRQFEEALRRIKDHALLLANACDVLRRLGRLEEAIQLGEKAVAQVPWNHGAHGNLAMALLQAGRVEEAVAHHREWLRLQPGYTGVNYEFAVALMQMRRMPEALAELEEMLARNADDAETHNLLGVVLVELGHRERARRAFERALRLAPGTRTAQENLERLRAMPETPATGAPPRP
ncbi:MAG: tetratricopeptide repeat protein [Verrucomicrobia bacterium]|nr:tetratricopeptide repeat protein [Verrucomicrobiota bacterium]